MQRLLAGMIFAIALAGCQTAQTPETGAPVDERTPSASQPGAGAATAGTPGGAPSGRAGAGGPGGPGGTGPGASTTPTPSDGRPGAAAGGGARPSSTMSPLKDPASQLSKRSVFFEYDSYSISEQFRPLLQAHAKYLAENRNARVRIEGNTDERGSREYNIALGQRRADAVRRMLQAMGAADAQMETVSLGEEKPRNAGHDESAWAENRRADLVYAGE